MWNGIIILGVLLSLIFMVSELISSAAHQGAHQIIAAQKANTRTIISTIKRTEEPSFTHYLSGYWTSKAGLVRLDFSGPDTITMEGGTPIVIQIVAENFGNGNLEFSINGDPKEVGWVRKVWNADAISLEMPGQKQIYLYHYMPLKQSKTIEMRIKKGKK